ncbi:MAG TPA: ATP-binding cassette domain-containing protein [Xanthobacteraceae bacterium]|nr:ATP-binding cassette domain-containing protein [Xanthobacteraceae bacterium]
MVDSAVMQVSDLRAGYKKIPILLGVSFRIAAGELVGILGHNGMGKTTLMRALVGALPATGGSIVLAGKDVTRLPTHLRARGGIGYVPQGRDIFPNLSVRENLAIGAAGLGHPVNEAVDRAVADFPILNRLLDRKGGALSGGEQQILALARALIGQPKVLLLDEPTEGIQPSIVEEIEDHLLRLARETNLAVVVVEQDVEFIASLAQRVLVIQKGQIVRELDGGSLNDPHVVDEVMGFSH